ncbi:PAAR domain-containing protein [Cupriavidus oxalaticus]|uniref:PAAR domain-containing protein n=1 Tax=Cupriavidus oxalaticus TaxID=96344 RepID=UPI003D17260C
MAGVRNALVDGDRTSTGGTLIGTGDIWHHGVRVAVEGDVATCPVCKKGGKAFNDRHPVFDLMGKQILVEGARVYCSCAVKPFVISSQNNFT